MLVIDSSMVTHVQPRDSVGEGGMAASWGRAATNCARRKPASPMEAVGVGIIVSWAALRVVDKSSMCPFANEKLQSS